MEKREKKMEREDVNSVHCDIGRRRKSMNEKEYFHSARSVFDALDNLFFFLRNTYISDEGKSETIQIYHHTF